ncbi:MAG: hypothetical protein M3Y13_01295 [Armatimonadota bacterium]|nr:hypothetical protein [Armatimonadota bacterium]
MLNRNAQYYEWLLPYLEGGLDDTRRAQMEARLRDDPALAAEAARLRRTIDGLRAAARQPRPASAQVPRDLWPRLRAQLGERAEPAPTSARPAHAWWLTGVGATAAATLALAMIWLPGWHAPSQQDLHPENHSPNPSVSPPGPGRIAGPPPVSPAGLPHTAPIPSVVAGPKPMPVKQPGQATVPTNAAVPPAPTVSMPSASTADPFVLPPPPAAALNGARKPTVLPGGSLAVKPAMPTAARSLGMAASHQPSRPGAGETVPSPAAPDRPASPPLVAAAPPAPNLDHFTNGAGANAGVTNGQNEVQAAPAAPNTAQQAKPAPQTKSQGNVFAVIPLTTPRDANGLGQGMGQNKTMAKRAASASLMNNALQAQAMAGGGFPGGGFGGGNFGDNAQRNLDTWQATLAAAMKAPLWGDTSGEQQAGQALMAAKESGALDELRARLEARRAQSPKDLVTGRMLAAVYEFGFSKEAALHERQRVANLEGAVGEDWYALAQAEDRAGSTEAARTAYRRALECPVPPSPYHAAIARARS